MELEIQSTRNPKTNKTTTVKIGNRSLRVFKKIPKNIEKKLLACRKEILNLGPEYTPTSMDEAEQPLHFILAALCVDSPYNQIDFWQSYGRASKRDCYDLLNLITSQLTALRTGGISSE